eukprot:6188528-Pleurochrysis_carterae.AAC.1
MRASCEPIGASTRVVPYATPPHSSVSVYARCLPTFIFIYFVLGNPGEPCHECAHPRRGQGRPRRLACIPWLAPARRLASTRYITYTC